MNEKHCLLNFCKHLANAYTVVTWAHNHYPCHPPTRWKLADIRILNFSTIIFIDAKDLELYKSLTGLGFGTAPSVPNTNERLLKLCCQYQWTLESGPNIGPNLTQNPTHAPGRGPDPPSPLQLQTCPQPCTPCAMHNSCTIPFFSLFVLRSQAPVQT